MTQQTSWDFELAPPALRTTNWVAVPRARNSDPVTSHAAARKVAPSRSELTRAIVWYVEKRYPVSRFDIERALIGGLWRGDTIRTRVSAMAKDGLIAEADKLGVSPSGLRCIRYRPVSGRGEA